jgi:acetoin utilization deacetylase AcuC-like enzyme
MRAFWDKIQLTHTPQFFLQRGHVRRNFEVPARAEALLASCRTLGMDIVTPPAADLAAIGAVHSQAYLDFLRAGAVGGDG